MLNVGDKVHISNPKTQSKDWKDNDGIVVQILDAQNSVNGTMTKVHIVRIGNGTEAPVEEKYLTKID